MPTNRDLDLAARAVGYDQQPHWLADFEFDKYEAFYPVKKFWDPLLDDKDAFRLAARLGAEIKTFCMPVYLEDKPYITVRVSFWNDDQPSIIERRVEYTKDQMQAIRQAIFDVAVEIGTKVN